MKHLVSSMLALLLLAYPCFAEVPELVESYAEMAADVWNSGQVCRHAVATLADRAHDERIAYMVPIYSFPEDPEYGHVMFAMKYQDKWYFIDSVLSGKKYVGAHAVYDDYAPEDIAGLSKMSDRNLGSYEGDADEETIYWWSHEEERRKMILEEIDKRLADLSQIKVMLAKTKIITDLIIEQIAEMKQK